MSLFFSLRVVAYPFPSFGRVIPSIDSRHSAMVSHDGGTRRVDAGVVFFSTASTATPVTPHRHQTDGRPAAPGAPTDVVSRAQIRREQYHHTMSLPAVRKTNTHVTPATM
ncbi:hypothetical protein QE152_g33162 [Popillia japonica]|uniref:Secreted protein n=1 Tax=Popillia japonica TaxID=7064 RepID=A0AAW1IY73_POPJA